MQAIAPRHLEGVERPDESLDSYPLALQLEASAQRRNAPRAPEGSA